MLNIKVFYFEKMSAFWRKIGPIFQHLKDSDPEVQGSSQYQVALTGFMVFQWTQTDMDNH